MHFPTPVHVPRYLHKAREVLYLLHLCVATSVSQLISMEIHCGLLEKTHHSLKCQIACANDALALCSSLRPPPPDSMRNLYLAPLLEQPAEADLCLTVALAKLSSPCFCSSGAIRVTNPATHREDQ